MEDTLHAHPQHHVVVTKEKGNKTTRYYHFSNDSTGHKHLANEKKKNKNLEVKTGYYDRGGYHL